jgi:SAM-dependent methyltransferase
MAGPADERVAGATLKERTVGRGWELFEPIDAAYERGEIDEAEWHRRVGAIIGPAYLAATDPRSQSGSSSTPEGWERARRFIFAAVDRDGTFLDVGCANGHLMECAVAWLAEAGHRVEPYGLDILPELVDLARRRLPQWADRIVCGNPMDWTPARPFDFVRTGLEYVPARLRPELVRHFLATTVAPGGRLIIGAHAELATSPPQLEAEVADWGFRIAGRAEVPHHEDHRVVRRAFWIDRPELSPR